jgi:DNA polymerase-3 subunit alpha
MQAGIDNKRSRLVLLAKNHDGYKNLIKLVTLSHLEGFYYKPRIDEELIGKYNENLVCISPSFSGEISQAIKNKNKEKALAKLNFYKKVYGNDNFFLEITRHPEIPNHEPLMKELIAFAKETDTQIVAAHDVYYINPEDREARDTLVLVNTLGDASDKRDESEDEDFSLISGERAEELFKDIPEAIANTKKISDMCNIEITLGKWIFPNFIVESGLSYDDELRRIVFEGIEKRKVERTKELIDRIEYELKVIKDKGYSQYFLVVWDLLHYSHANGILTNIKLRGEFHCIYSNPDVPISLFGAI